MHFVGDVMYDAALHFSGRAERESRILENLGLEKKPYILATVHRKENTDNIDCLSNILAGFVQGSAPVVWPMHPRTLKRLREFQIEIPNIIRVIEPVGYLDMVMLEKHASLIATDSGGVQKEAYFHKVPCITLRKETEWVELVEGGIEETFKLFPGLFNEVGTRSLVREMLNKQRSVDSRIWRIVNLGIWGRVFGVTI